MLSAAVVIGTLRVNYWPISEKGGENNNSEVASPERIPIHFKHTFIYLVVANVSNYFIYIFIYPIKNNTESEPLIRW